ncbi:MAG TPA: SAM-dependent methyltransferase [Mycobacteriales bacterium]|nr:SAM-dependent methyltransferase [Mycobacteriales bacterium]
MARYALLLRPAANRVYAAAATPLVAAELRAFLDADPGVETNDAEVDSREIAGTTYLTVEGPELSAASIARLSNLSAAYALFEVTDDELLRPVPLTPLDRYDDDLLTILKYSGKTNEQFTKLLLNVTAVASSLTRDGLDRPLRVLDPMCGRGTTLNQALMYGWHASGVDLDRADVDAYATFLRTWLERKRLKHRLNVAQLRVNRKVVGRRLDAETAATRELWDAGATQQVTVLTADTTTVAEHFRRESFDLVVADLPYGVQHGSRNADKGLARNPMELLDAALPGWCEVLRPGGAMGLSWNTKVASRHPVLARLRQHGLEVLDDPPYDGFAHRVDQAIVRDLVVARRT